jgi:hypothetical protein
MSTDSDDCVFVDDHHSPAPQVVNELQEDDDVRVLRDLTVEEEQYLWDNCHNQMHYFQEELRLRLSPAEL